MLDLELATDLKDYAQKIYITMFCANF